jgi:hypothetical protein
MAIINLGNEIYAGLSTDTKPTTGIPAGAMFIETNTGSIFVWNGSSWVASAGGSVTASSTTTFTNKDITYKDNNLENVATLYHMRESGLVCVGTTTMINSGLLYLTANSLPTTPTYVSDTNGRYVTKSAGTGNTIGTYTATYITTRALNPRLRGSMGFGTLAASADARMYFGFITAVTNSASDTPMATTDSGVLIGARTTDANFQVFNNDGTGAIVVTDTGVAKSASSLTHFEIIASDSAPNFKCYVNGVLKATLTTRIPATGAQLMAESWVIPATATVITSNWGFVQLEHMTTTTANWATGVPYAG